jgi:hypothetical protein
MIRAPFRFDVGCFSVIVVVRNVDVKEKHFFDNEREKRIYLDKVAKGDDMSPRYFLSEEKGYCIFLRERQFLCVLAQDKNTNKLYSLLSSQEDMLSEVKEVF